MTSVKAKSRRAALGVALFVCTVSSVTGGAPAALADMAHEPVVLVTGQGERTLDVEIATTPEEMARGLMFRSSLADTTGMLFPSQAPREVQMWMRNTFIPLDMVFIKEDGRVARIEAMTEPLSERIIASEGAVLAVLEIAGGAAQKFGLKPGDTVRHRLFHNAP